MSKTHKTILQEETEDGGTFLECQHLGNEAGRSEVQGHSWLSSPLQKQKVLLRGSMLIIFSFGLLASVV